MLCNYQIHTLPSDEHAKVCKNLHNLVKCSVAKIAKQIFAEKLKQNSYEEVKKAAHAPFHH